MPTGFRFATWSQDLAVEEARQLPINALQTIRRERCLITFQGYRRAVARNRRRRTRAKACPAGPRALALQRSLQPPRRFIHGRLRLSTCHLLSSPLLLGQRRNVPEGALSIRGTGLDIPEPVAYAVRNKLGAVFLRAALVHTPAVVGSRGQPARGRVSSFRGFARPLVRTERIFRRITVIEKPSRMVQVLGRSTIDFTQLAESILGLRPTDSIALPELFVLWRARGRNPAVLPPILLI